MSEEKESPAKNRLRNRHKKESSESVTHKEELNGSVKSKKERLASEDGEKPDEESKQIKGDDVAAGNQVGPAFDWDQLLQFKLELDGIAIILFVVSFLTRTFRLSAPNHIVFDELHYGKYIRMYNERTFFFDQHPPFGKQLIAAITNVVGFGNYTFSKIGAPYNEVSA